MIHSPKQQGTERQLDPHIGRTHRVRTHPASKFMSSHRSASALLPPEVSFKNHLERLGLIHRHKASATVYRQVFRQNPVSSQRIILQFQAPSNAVDSVSNVEFSVISKFSTPIQIHSGKSRACSLSNMQKSHLMVCFNKRRMPWRCLKMHAERTRVMEHVALCLEALRVAYWDHHEQYST